jgi:ribosomal protein S18 acetylase RimI-like enzyme
MNSLNIKDTPWDSRVFGIYTAEILEYSSDALAFAKSKPGHYTLKLNPLEDKSLALAYGFYYCDTLLEPVCKKGKLTISSHPDIQVSGDVPLSDLLKICHGAFSHGRFQRDPYLDKTLADKRYDRWLEDLAENGKVYGLLMRNKIAGFIATKDNQLQLHAIAKEYQGKGIAKYWWSTVCDHLFAQGYETVTSSISASNLPVLNLYASLGFRFLTALDVYHLLVSE